MTWTSQYSKPSKNRWLFLSLWLIIIGVIMLVGDAVWVVFSPHPTLAMKIVGGVALLIQFCGLIMWSWAEW